MKNSQPGQPAQSVVKCSGGHNLVFYTTAKARGFGKAGLSVRCDFCKRSIPNIIQGYYTCQSLCDFDCCKDCYAFKTANQQPQGEAKPYQQGRTCAQGHRLNLMTDRKARAGIMVIGSQVNCDICRALVNIQNGYYTCGFACDYDCCKNCYQGPPVQNPL